LKTASLYIYGVSEGKIASIDAPQWETAVEGTDYPGVFFYGLGENNFKMVNFPKLKTISNLRLYVSYGQMLASIQRPYHTY
jgi:hypothetical protein